MMIHKIYIDQASILYLKTDLDKINVSDATTTGTFS